MPFTLRLALAFVIAAIAAAVVAPLAAVAVAAAGFRFPFPRIFDRTVMVSLAAMLVLWARRLGLAPLLRRGFAHPAHNLEAIVRGLLTAAAVIAILLGLAAMSGGKIEMRGAEAFARAPKYIGGAILIAIIEEGFFRAVLLGGMVPDFGRTAALVISAAVYAGAHVVRAPARYYASGYDPAAGVHNLGASFAQLAHPAHALPALIGLFLLGLVLGEAFLLTGNVYYSAGLHAGLVLGAKLWPYGSTPATSPAPWIAGYARPALISGAAAWLLALAILILIPRFTGRRA